MKISIKVIIIVFLLNLSFSSFSQSKIDKSKEELKKGRESNGTKNRTSSSPDDDFSDNIFTEIAAKIFLYVTYYSFIGNYADEYHLQSNLTKYPYYNNLSGNYENADSIPSPTKIMRIDLEDRLLIGTPNLYGNHFKTKLRPFQFFYLQVDYFQLFEYNRIVRSYSNLSLFNFNFCYDRIRFEKFNLGWTLGANYVGNDVKKVGISCGLNTDIFLRKTISLYSSMKWGLINDATVNEFELQFKYHRKNYFYSLGYEHLKIASPTYDFISIGTGIYF